LSVPSTVTPLLPADQRIDDPTIPNTLIVWRTLDPLETRIDPATSLREIMSSAFRSEEVSVHMSDSVSQTDVVRKNRRAYLAEFTV